MEETIAGLGWSRIEAEDSIYVKSFDGVEVDLGVYVDDMYLDGDSDEATKLAADELQDLFPITFTPGSTFIGINIDFVGEGKVMWSQYAYVMKVVSNYLKKCPGEKIKTAWTPIVKSQPDRTFDDEKGVMADVCREVLGAVLFVARCTRYDVSFAVQRLCRHVSCWTQRDDRDLHRLMCYMWTTANTSMVWNVSGADCGKLRLETCKLAI